MKSNKVSNKKSKKERFASHYEGIMKQHMKAVRGNHFMEAYILGWSSIEQFALPELIEHVSEKLKLKTPKGVSGTPAIHLIRYYYFLTHDKELYDALERARKRRNTLTHNLIKHETWKDVKDSYKDGLKIDILNLFELFIKRYEGDAPYPVLQLYADGWNACKESFREELEKYPE